MSSLVEARAVSYRYGSGVAATLAIDGVSLAVEPGELVLILGPSGSGKTTLLSMLGGLLTPTQGQMLIEGRDLASLDEDARSAVRRGSVGFIFQSFNLLRSLTVLENVEVALNLRGLRGSRAGGQARAALVAVGLGEKARSYPAELSGGEKQRVSIARAIVARPPLLLADEPTGNLDSRTGRQMIELLASFTRERETAVVVVTHDTRMALLADRIIEIEDGRVAPGSALKPPSIRPG